VYLAGRLRHRKLARRHDAQLRAKGCRLPRDCGERGLRADALRQQRNLTETEVAVPLDVPASGRLST
jgi:hypothetical protein